MSMELGNVVVDASATAVVPGSCNSKGMYEAMAKK